MRKGSDRACETLINAGADINNTILQDKTPLIHALSESKYDCAETLIEYGADVSIPVSVERELFTPLSISIVSDCDRGDNIANKILNSGKEYWKHSDLVLDLLMCILVNRKVFFEKLLPKARNLGKVCFKKTLLISSIMIFQTTKDPYFFDKLMSIGLDKNALDVRTVYGTALEYAVRNQCRNIAKQLIEAGADITPDDKGVSIMHIAAENGDTEMIEYLAGKGISVDITSNADRTPIMYAMKGGYTKAIDLLLRKGAKYNVQDRYGKTLLMYALDNKQTFLSNWLVSTGKIDLYPSDNNGWAALRYAALLGNPDIMIKMIKSGNVNVNKRDREGRTPLMTVAWYGTVEAAKILINNGAKINDRDDKGRTPLMYAAANDQNNDILNLLINNGGDIEARDNSGWTPLMYAVRNEIPRNVMLLLDRGADHDVKDRDNNNLVHIAVANNGKDTYQTVDYLMSYGVDVNVCNADGDTPLIIAVRNDNEKIVSCLLENKAKPNIGNGKGEFPIIYAINNNNKSILKLLLDYNADVNITDNQSHTPLMFASIKDVDFIDLILRAGAKVNFQDRFGMTALMHACREGNAQNVSYLIKYGNADLHIKDKEGCDAEYYASLMANAVKSALRSEDIDEKEQEDINKGSIGFDLSGTKNKDKERREGTFEDRAR
jgi:ankyrin repeat protein